MFPNVDRKSKSSNEDPQKQIAQNTSRMVELMLSMARSHDQLNKKTDLLLKISNDIVKSNTDMCKVSQTINHQSNEAIKYIRRIGKRLLDVQQKYNQDKELEGGNPMGDLSPVRKPASTSYYDTNLRGLPSSSEPVRQVSNPANGLSHKSTIRKEDSHMAGEDSGLLMKILDGLEILKKDIKEMKLNKGDSIRVSFKKIEEVMLNNTDEIETDKLNTEISSWIGELFRNVTDIAYKKYIQNEASEQETNLLFCQAIILNLLDFMDFMRDTNMGYWIKNRFSIADLCSDAARKILKFLKTKFPRNKKNFISTQFQDKVQKINNSEDPRFDILHNIGIEFPAYDPGVEVHYTREIKTMFNLLMQEVQLQYPEFHRTMTKIFTSGNKVMAGQGKFKIGKKFRDNVPLFSEQELGSFDFKCRSPEILRILIKWLEELEQFVKKPQVSIMEKKAFKDLRIKVKEVMPASAAIRKKIADHLEMKVQSIKKTQAQNNEILTDLYDNLCQLVTEKPTGIQFLNLDDVKAIKFSQLISSSLPFLTVVRIQQIIKILRTFQKDFKGNQLENLDLVSFSVFDLLRSKCSGSKDQIMTIYEAIKSSDYFVVSRVKNRLDTPMNDLLINCKLNNSPLVCEIQLLITNEFITEKDDKNDHFNHFLYELERSRFGPFSEACMIINTNDPRMEYASELKKIRMVMKRLTDEDKKRLHLADAIKTCHLGHQLQPLHFSLPFVCVICSSFYNEYSSAFNGLKCKICSMKICPACVMNQVKSEDKRKEFYLGKSNITKKFFEDRIIELRRKDPKGQAKLQTLIYTILSEEDHEFCMLIRFSQGIVTKRGFRRHDKNKTISPAYFLLRNELPELGKCQKYDIILLVKKPQVGDFQIKTIKELKKCKDLDFLNHDAQLDLLQLKAAELQKSFVCSVVDDKILVLDYDDVEKDIENLMEKNRINAVLVECATTRSSTLDLSSLDLSTLDFLEKSSQKLSHVLTIVADENRIENIDVLFTHFPNLGKISLKKNKVNCEEIDISNTNIIDIFLGQNSFVKLPLIKSNKLLRIVFKKNHISDISNLYKCVMNNLVEIGLTENEIPDVPPCSFPKLSKFIIKQNKIKSLANLSTSESTLPQLQTLSCDDNLIEEVPILDYPQMKVLQLKNNKIPNIDWLKLSNLPKLQILRLGKNKLTSFTTCKLDKLTILDLSSNQIQDISFLKEKDFYKNLKELYLSKNRIKKIFNLTMPKLVILRLTQNEISTFNPNGKNEVPMPTASQKQFNETFFQSELPNLQELSIVKGNKFLGRQIIAMEIYRVFTTVKLIE